MRRNPSEVLDARVEDLDQDGGRWYVVCRKHGEMVTVNTKAQAMEDARHCPSEFCEGCREEVLAHSR